MKKNTFKKYICLALCLVLAASVLAGCGSTSGAASEPAAATEAPAAATEAPAEESAAPAGLVDSIKAKGKLVVGTEAQYAPYEFKDLDANFAGCDMWLAQQIADNVLDHVDQHNTSIVLMHDASGKNTTVEALPIIIEKILESENTVLLPITEDTVPIQHVQAE